MSCLKTSSDQQLYASLFERWKSRPLPDPNRPRPVVEAIKSLMTQFVQTAGPTLMPMLLEMLQKSLGSISAASSASVANPESIAEASDLQIAGELAARHSAGVSSLLPDYSWFMNLFQDAVGYFGPIAVQWFIGELQKLITPAAE